MKHLKRFGQAGFGTEEVLIVVLVVIILGLGTILVWKTHNNKSAQPSTSLSSQPVVDNSTTAHSLDGGRQFVDSTYQQYIQAQSTNHQGRAQGLELIKPKLTSDLYSSIKAGYQNPEGEDAIICAQMLPTTYNVTATNQTANSGNYVVTESFGSKQQVPVKVTVDLSTLLISNITCP